MRTRAVRALGSRSAASAPGRPRRESVVARSVTVALDPRVAVIGDQNLEAVEWKWQLKKGPLRPREKDSPPFGKALAAARSVPASRTVNRDRQPAALSNEK